ncbi:MAG: sensor protein [Holophagaceae bacterium]|nr:sensor protein [Holophagaceae bacterium]
MLPPPVSGINLEMESKLRLEVAASWMRCQAAGLDPQVLGDPLDLSDAEVLDLIGKKAELIRHARPFMVQLHKFLTGTSFVLLLFDETGHLLETVGDARMLRGTRHFARGASWAESSLGTNAAGMTLTNGHPFQVSGSEHFHRLLQSWTSSAAPIFSEGGKLVGILSLVGPAPEAHAHTLGMILASAKAVERELRVRLKHNEMVLLDNHFSSILLTVSDAVIVLDVDGIILQINPVAERLLGTTNRNVVGNRMDDLTRDSLPIHGLLGRGVEFNDREMELHWGRGRYNCLASGRPIRDESSTVIGGVFFFNPIHKIKQLVNRFSGAEATFRFEDILGEAKVLKKAIQLGQLASQNNSNVLLTGDSGTGKEMFAQAIHNRSRRAGGPFIAVNCGAIPRELIASELFGYQEGSFTGANKGGRPGKFELASGGTLFLDEIGDMPIEQQVALLRVLQDRTITRIGGEGPLAVDVRIICATNKDLPGAIQKGTLREDLYYRLNVSPIPLPSLKEHLEDIPLLVKAFLNKLAPQPKGLSHVVDPAVVETLQAYSWPGNVRELQNAVERIAHAANGSQITLEHLPEEFLSRLHPAPEHPAPPPLAQPLGSGTLRQQLDHQEKTELMSVLMQQKGCLTKCAAALGISRNTLYRRLNYHGIEMGKRKGAQASAME